MKVLRKLMICSDLWYIVSKGLWGCISSSVSLFDASLVDASLVDASLVDASLVDASLLLKPNVLHYGLRTS